MFIDSSLEAVADSGTTGHYITPTTPCMNKQTATQPIPINITSSHVALLPQHNLPDKARKAHMFPGLQKPLISIGTLCDNNCIAVFDEKRVTIYDKTTRQIFMQGHRDPKTTLYMINMTAPQRAMTEQHIPDTLRANHVYGAANAAKLMKDMAEPVFLQPVRPPRKYYKFLTEQQISDHEPMADTAIIIA